jgi:hypothetical protein
MIYRRQDFVDVVWLLPHPLLSSLERLRKRANLLRGIGGKEEVEEERNP